MTSATGYNPGADEDTTSQVTTLGQQAVDAGGRGYEGIARMSVDGLQGDAAAGYQELAQAVQQATEATNDAAQYVVNTSNEYGQTSGGTDAKYAGVIRGS